MKIGKAIIILFLLYGCNDPSAVKNLKPDAKTAATDSLRNMGPDNSDSEYARAAHLIIANDCFSCHQLKTKSIGPSLFDISLKYHTNAGNVDNLAHEIIKGSDGVVWGKNVMNPHPNLNFSDAEEMVKYIFSLTEDKP